MTREARLAKARVAVETTGGVLLGAFTARDVARDAYEAASRAIEVARGEFGAARDAREAAEAAYAAAAVAAGDAREAAEAAEAEERTP